MNSRDDFRHSPDERREILLDSLSQCKQSQPIMAKNHDLILCLFFFFNKSLKMAPGPGRPLAGTVSASGRGTPNRGYNEGNGKQTIEPS